MTTLPSPPRSAGARFGRATAAVIVSILALVVGLALGALAAVLGLGVSLPLGLLAGGLVLFFSTWVLTALAHKTWPPSGRRPRPALARRKSPYVVAGATLAIVAVAAGTTVLAPIEGSESPSAAADPSFWDLDTGSRVAYWKFEASGGDASDVPIIFVHGGPGGYITDADLDFFPQLTSTGHDVYVYDQPGAGFSPDLELDEYTEERWLADLDAIREETGSETAIVIGQSAGGYIVEAYAANYPEHVEKAVLTAPGGYLASAELTAAEEIEDQEIQRLDPDFATRGGEAASLASKITPRIGATVMLYSLGFPDAAENLSSQKELKAWSATAMDSDFGLNFLSNLALNAEFTEHMPDTLDKLEELEIPTMMLKPQFDYVSWTSQYPYVKANRDMQVVYIEDAEHNAWKMQPKAALDAIATFIEGGEQELYTGTKSPAITLGDR